MFACTDMRRAVDAFAETIRDEKLKKTFQNCFYSTLDTTVKEMPDGSYYVFTGDIPAMWLRDSSAQVIQYLGFVRQCAQTRQIVKGMLSRQFFYIRRDPYANAFNETDNNHGHKQDLTEHNPWVWERKFEIDSLCYPLFLAYRYYQISGDETIFSDAYKETVRVILRVFRTEQRHSTASAYAHFRPGEDAALSIPNGGKGGPVGYTGMIWSGYRPSDDACRYGYFIPGNQFAVVVLKQLEELFSTVVPDAALSAEASALRGEIQNGIRQYGIVKHPTYGEMYAYEVDGLGNVNLMDDANVPSLLSLPYLGYCDATDPVYRNTRRFVLSAENPYYFSGKALRGVGSPHTPNGYVWHIGVIMQALTSDDPAEIRACLTQILQSDAGKCLMHEGVDCNDASRYSREWFAWANSLFAYFILEKRAALSAYFTE